MGQCTGVSQAGPGGVLCGHVGRGGNGDKLPENIFGHVNVVVSYDKGLLDVLVGVALAHEVLNLAGELRGGGRDQPCATALQAAARFPFRVDPPRQGFWGPLRDLGAIRHT